MQCLLFIKACFPRAVIFPYVETWDLFMIYTTGINKTPIEHQKYVVRTILMYKTMEPQSGPPKDLSISEKSTLFKNHPHVNHHVQGP